MSYYTQDETYRITSRLYKLLKEEGDHILIRKLRGNLHGKYDPESGKIFLDYRGEVISTLFHEALHKWYPDWCETKVLEYESKIMNSLSVRQIKNVIKAMATYC